MVSDLRIPQFLLKSGLRGSSTMSIFPFDFSDWARFFTFSFFLCRIDNDACLDCAGFVDMYFRLDAWRSDRFEVGMGDSNVAFLSAN